MVSAPSTNFVHSKERGNRGKKIYFGGSGRNVSIRLEDKLNVWMRINERI